MRSLRTLFLLALLTLPLGACDFVGDVLEFGFWMILILVGLVALLAWGLFALIRNAASRGDRRPPP